LFEEVERGKEVSNLILWRGAYSGTTIRFAISDRFKGQAFVPAVALRRAGVFIPPGFQ